MSKAKLRKELEDFSREQLVEVILAAYDSSPKAKEYFEFFLNPDANQLMDKVLEGMIKEVNRTKWGVCKARISVLRKAVKEFAAFGVGPEKHAELLYLAFRLILGQAYYYEMPDPLRNGMLGFAAEYVTIAARNDFIESATTNLEKAITDLARPRMAKMIREYIDTTLTNLKTDK